MLLNPFYTNKFCEALRKKAKTDNIDALVIAQLLRTGEYGNCLVPDETVQTLRELVKLRYEFIKDLQNYKRQVLTLLSLVFPEYHKTALKNPFAIASLKILQQFPTAKHLAVTSVKHLEKIVRCIKDNNFNGDKLQQFINTAKNSRPGQLTFLTQTTTSVTHKRVPRPAEKGHRVGKSREILRCNRDHGERLQNKNPIAQVENSCYFR